MLEDKKVLLYLGSDHAGFQVKAKVREYLKEKGYSVTDLGTFSEESVDYPDIAREVGEKILEHDRSFGILICGTGIGMSIAANKLRGIRAALCTSVELATLAREHNDANIIAMGARTQTFEEMKPIMDAFLDGKFSSDNERHVRRVKKLNGEI